MNSGGDVLAFFNDELTTFRNKNARFICNVKKIKIGFMQCKKRCRIYAKRSILSIFLILADF